MHEIMNVWNTKWQYMQYMEQNMSRDISRLPYKSTQNTRWISYKKSITVVQFTVFSTCTWHDYIAYLRPAHCLDPWWR